MSDTQSYKSISAVPGFRTAGAKAGIKRSRRLDLALIASDRPASAAAVYTTNKIVSPSIDVCRQHLRNGRAQAIVINSGISNACTGTRGRRDALAMCKTTARHLKINAADVVVASTGIIGEFLPMQKISTGIGRAVKKLRCSAASDRAAASAIMTTDTVPKCSSLHCRCGGQMVHLAGIAKGSGMIAPNMATMLAFIASDAAISPALLRHALKRAVDSTFNCITVDMHTSTSDMVAVLANGASESKPLRRGTAAYRAFVDALTILCNDLAAQIVADGEGATRIIKITITGAASAADARKAAMAIANSPLVKCAFHGADPNWGRIVSAAGYSGAKCDPNRMVCRLAGKVVFNRGKAAKFNAAQLSKQMQKDCVLVALDLGAGRSSGHALTCDLSQDYIKINADYHT